MDDLKHIRKRIKQRRFGYERNEDQRRPPTLFRIVYRFIMLVMGLCVIVLTLLLNQKLNVVQMPAVLQNFNIENIAGWLPFEGWFNLKDEAVSAKPTYSLLKENHYSNGSNIAYNSYDAVVLHIQVNKDKKTSLTLKQDNGIIATYGNLTDVSLKQDERVLKGRPLGTYAQYVTIDFLKDNKRIGLNAALQNTN